MAFKLLDFFRESFTGKYGKFLGTYSAGGKRVKLLERDLDEVSRVAAELDRERPDWHWSDYDLEMACLDRLLDHATATELDMLRIKAAVKAWWDWDVARTRSTSKN